MISFFFWYKWSSNLIQVKSHKKQYTFALSCKPLNLQEEFLNPLENIGEKPSKIL